MPVMALFFLKTTTLIRKQQKYKRHCDHIKEQAPNWRFNYKNKKTSCHLEIINTHKTTMVQKVGNQEINYKKTH